MTENLFMTRLKRVNRIRRMISTGEMEPRPGILEGAEGVLLRELRWLKG